MSEDKNKLDDIYDVRKELKEEHKKKRKSEDGNFDNIKDEDFLTGDELDKLEQINNSIEDNKGYVSPSLSSRYEDMDDIKKRKKELGEIDDSLKKRENILNWSIVVLLFLGIVIISYYNFFMDKTVVVDMDSATEIALSKIPTKPIEEKNIIMNPERDIKNNPPIAEFLIRNNPIYVGEVVDIEDKSYDPDMGDRIMNYRWEGKQNLYTKEGSYPISLKVQDSNGQWSAPVMHVIEVVNKEKIVPNIRPVATFSVSSPVYVGEEVVYENNSFDPDNGELIDTLWKGKRVRFDKIGKYEVTLQVRDDEREWSDIASQTIIVKERPYIHSDTKPVAMFKLKKNTVLVYESVEFIDMSYDLDGDEIIEWDWSGAKQKEYTKPGEYLVNLQVIDEHGNKSERYTEKITVVLPNNDRPVADFRTNSPVIIGEAVEFYNESYDVDGIIEESIWGGDKRYSYDKSGEYDVTLTVIDNKGNKDTVTHRIIVLDKPNIEPTSYFEINEPIKEGERVYYFNQSFDKDGDIAKIEWEGKESSFDEEGTYPVTLTVYDELGAKNSYTKNIVVFPNTNKEPTAIISGPSVVNINQSAIFTDNSYDSDGYIVSNSWGADRLTKTWETPGTKYIKLEVTDNKGRIDEVVVPILVKE